MRTRDAVVPRWLAAAALAATAAAGCGGDDDAAPMAGVGETDPTATPAGTADPSTATAARSAEVGPAGCPTGAAVSAAYGLEMEFNTDFSITEDWLIEEMGGATCQYNQVLAPGATDPSGLDAVAYIATIELMRSDPTPDVVGGEPVDGIGDQAMWNGAQLSVWDGARGVRITNQYPPPGQDARATAIALAELALANEWPRGSGTGGEAGAAPATPATSAPGGQPNASDEPADCPADDAISSEWGKPMTIDTANAMTGAIGLVFCPYVEVIAPGTTDAWGTEALGDFFSLTFTNQNPIEPIAGGTPVEGIGEQAVWSASVLSVWTGERGLIVDVTFPPEGRDGLDVALGLAGLALGIDTSGAEPGDAPTADALDCPDAAVVSTAADADLELSGDLSVGDETFWQCAYQATDASATHLVFIQFVAGAVETDDEAEPVEGLGDAAWWQEEIAMLTVSSDGRTMSINVVGEFSVDSRTVTTAVAEAVL